MAPGAANAGGAGNGVVQNGQAIGTGTGIANAGPGMINLCYDNAYLSD